LAGLFFIKEEVEEMEIEYRDYDILNYPTPDISVLAYAGIWVLIVLGFAISLMMFPEFTKWLFSYHTPNRDEVKPQPREFVRERSRGEFGFNKYNCVSEEMIYHEVDEEPMYIPPPVIEKTTDSSVIKDAVDALATLGYKKTESKRLVNAACEGGVFTDAAELVKATMSRTNV